jgi:L,D-transpeptidase-like protein/putative peptidoglycan binding protein/sporulation and spore germination protein
MSRRILFIGLAVALGVPVAAAPADATAPTETVQVAFFKHGRLVRVDRTVRPGLTTEVAALRELVQGPTRLERAHGVRSAIRPGVHLQSVRADDDVWLARFSRSLVAPATRATMERRFAQIESTLAPLGQERYVAIATEGRLVTTVRAHGRPGSWRPEAGEKGYPFSVRGLQLRLATLGYLDPASVSGTLDYLTEEALLAFQGWDGLARTGTVTGETQLALFRASRPRPTTHRTGRHVEIHRDLGVLLLVDGNDIVRAIHTSTGSFGRTPSGTFHVYRKELLSWSQPFHVWMPYAAYFVGGIAMHEYSDVPAYPASHGCVRLPAGEANHVYAFVDIGTPVYVF